MNDSSYWVIGGEYADTEFRQMIDGTGQVLGPFESYDEARQVWEDRSVATRCRALMRFNIACDGQPH